MPIVLPATMVVTQENLVREDRRQQLGTIIVQAAVPHAMFQLKQRFQPVVEWLDRLATPGIESLPTAAE